MALKGSIAGPTEGIVGPLPAGENTGLPNGGTAGQPLVKLSSANYDAGWQTLGVIGGGTGAITLAVGGILVANGTSPVTSSPTPTLGISGSLLGTLTLAGNTSGQVLLTPQAAAGTTTLTLPNTSGTVAASAAAPITLNATTGQIGVTSAALTSSNDTNVTITLGGTPTTALLAATSLTMGWSGLLATTRGGTGLGSYTLGDIVYASAANTLLQLAGNITTGKQYLSQTGTGTVSAAPAWATISGADITGSALTVANDTNVTLTLGGTPATSLLRAASVTAGWTGQLAVSRGGTGSGSLAVGGVLVGNGTSAVTSTATPTLGVAGSTLGTLSLANLTSGSITIQPVAGALGASVLTLPAATDTFALLAATQALTNKTVNGLTITSSTGTLTITNGKTLSISNTLTLAGTDSTTMTFPSSSATLAGLGITQSFTGINTFNQVIYANNAITASANAATVPVTFRLNTVTNNSAAALTVTLTTASAVDGQMSIIRILDFSAVSQTITWVNTENSTVTVPTTSNGSTTLPISVGFMYNSNTSKWRCIASA